MEDQNISSVLILVTIAAPQTQNMVTFTERYWRVHKGFESLAPKIKKKFPPAHDFPIQNRKTF